MTIDEMEERNIPNYHILRAHTTNVKVILPDFEFTVAKPSYMTLDELKSISIATALKHYHIANAATRKFYIIDEIRHTCYFYTG